MKRKRKAYLAGDCSGDERAQRDGHRATTTRYSLPLCVLFSIWCVFFLYFSVRGFSPLFRVCVPLTHVLLLLYCSLVSLVSVFSFFFTFCILLVPVFCSPGPLLSCLFFWVYFLFILCPVVFVPTALPLLLRPFSGFNKAREGLVSRPPVMAGIVEARDRGFRNGIVGIVAVIC